MMSDLKSGNIHIASSSGVQSYIPEASLMYLPFLYRDIAHFRNIWQLGANEVVQKIENLIRKRAQLEPLGYSIVGARDCILIDRPIQQPSDFKDLSIRVDGATISQQIFSALGASVIQVPFNEVANALAEHRVRAAENATFNMLALGWHSACKFVSCTEHRFLLNFELASGAFWAKLDNHTKIGIHDAFTAYLAAFANRSAIERSTSLHNLSQIHKLSVNKISPSEKSAFEVATKCVIDNYATDYGLHQEINWIREN